MFQSTKYSSFYDFELGLDEGLFKIEEDTSPMKSKRISRINLNLSPDKISPSCSFKQNSFKFTDNSSPVRTLDNNLKTFYSNQNHIDECNLIDKSPRKKTKNEIKLDAIKVNSSPHNQSLLNKDILQMNRTNFKIKLKTTNQEEHSNDVSKIYTSYGMPAIRKDMNQRIQKFLKQSNDRSRKYYENKDNKNFKIYDYIDSSKKNEVKHRTKFSIDIGKKKSRNTLLSPFKTKRNTLEKLQFSFDLNQFRPSKIIKRRILKIPKKLIIKHC